MGKPKSKEACADWSHARDAMLLGPNAVYLNTGAFGPTPRTVFERVSELRHQLCTDPTNFMLREVPSLLWRAREALASFVRAQPQHLMFASSVSAGISMIANSIHVQGPGELVLTDHEYTTMRWCWERAAQRLGLSIRTVRLPDDPNDADAVLARMTEALSERTRLLFFSHVLSATGAVLPARELCDAARARGIATVVDGAHAPGFTDLNLSELTCDFYVGSGHKWLLAPAGVAFVRFGADEHGVEPTTVSWGHAPERLGPDADRPDRFGSTARLRRFECEGTRDICPWLVVPEAIAFRQRFGHDRIQDRMRHLAAYARQRLVTVGELPPAAPAAGGISVFQISHDVDPETLCSELWRRFGVEVGLATVGGRRPLLRVCTHFFNTERDVDRLAQALVALRIRA